MFMTLNWKPHKKAGVVTDAMKIVAEKERMDVEQLRALVALGQGCYSL